MSDSDCLKRAVQALAQPASVQVELFPDFVVVGDELALDFGEALRRFINAGRERITSQQRGALEALDRELERLSGAADSDFWLNRSLATDLRWDNIRVLATTALREMKWPNVRPEPSDAIYVRGDR